MKISQKLVIGFATIIGFCVVSGVLSMVQITAINNQIDNVVSIGGKAAELEYHGDYMVHMMHHYLEDTGTGVGEKSRTSFDNHSEPFGIILAEITEDLPKYSTELGQIQTYYEQIDELCTEEGGIFDQLDAAKAISDQIHAQYLGQMAIIKDLEERETGLKCAEKALEGKYSFERLIHLMHHYLENTGVEDGSTRTFFAAEAAEFAEHMDYLVANSTQAQNYTTWRGYVEGTFIPSLTGTGTGMFDLLEGAYSISDTIHGVYAQKIADIDALLTTEAAAYLDEASAVKYFFEREIHLMHHYLEQTGWGAIGVTRTYIGLAIGYFTTNIDILIANSANAAAWGLIKTYHDSTFIPSLTGTGTGMFDLLDSAYGLSATIHGVYSTRMAQIDNLVEGEINTNTQDALEGKYVFEREIHLMHHYLEHTGIGVGGATRTLLAAESTVFAEHMDNLEANSIYSAEYTTWRGYVEGTFIPSLTNTGTGMFDLIDDAQYRSAEIHTIFPLMINLLGEIDQGTAAAVASARAAAGDAANLALVLIIGITIVAAGVGGVVAFSIITSISKPIKSLVANAESIANKDLRIAVSKEKKKVRDDEVGQLEHSFTDMVSNLTEIISTCQQSAEHVASSSEELASTSEEVNALSEEIAATIQQISRGASSQSGLAIKGIEDVSTMSKVVDESLGKIESTLHVIEDIAGQTNILALNAAIEAARAGEYGRGFAVVSDNVRRLAEETKSNAGDINKLTDEIVTNIGGSITGLQETLQGFAAQSEEFSASSEEVAAATEEQTAAMSQMTTAAQNLTKQGEELSQQVAEFKLREEVVKKS